MAKQNCIKCEEPIPSFDTQDNSGLINCFMSQEGMICCKCMGYQDAFVRQEDLIYNDH